MLRAITTEALRISALLSLMRANHQDSAIQRNLHGSTLSTTSLQVLIVDGRIRDARDDRDWQR